MTTTAELATAPRESYGKLFLRFLRFGSLAWGGPVAQIAMIRRELVDEEHWISNERFNRTLAVYQVLPGPEAHELCVYFGMLARGRVGGLLAGLGFMLPGFVLMFVLSWMYLSFGISPLFGAVFLGFQAAVVALIVRAVHRIGSHALHDKWLMAIAAIALIGSVLGVHFAVTLLVAGVAYALAGGGIRSVAALLLIAFVAGAAVYTFALRDAAGGASMLGTVPGPDYAEAGVASVGELFVSGLKAGLLTF